MMGPKLRKFVDHLPRMKTLKPKNKKGTYYEVQMKEFNYKMHRDLNLTRVWGYNSQFPGPIIDVMRGEPIQVKWMNKLPAKHFLPLDLSIHHVDKHPEVRTVTHLHGSETKPESDGYPEAWFTKDFEEVGPFFKQQVYDYPNR